MIKSLQRDRRGPSVVLIFIIFCLPVNYAEQRSSTYNTYNVIEQRALYEKAAVECFLEIINNTGVISTSDDNLTCPAEFKGVICWPQTSAGQIAAVDCPHYVHLFDYTQKAYRRCMADGVWESSAIVNSTNQRSVMNHSLCIVEVETKQTESPVTVPKLIQDSIPRIQLLNTVGFSISIICCLIASIILLSRRRLRCPRNMIHTHLFISFILRGVIAITFTHLPSQRTQLQTNIYDNEGDNPAGQWQCKLLYTIWMYVRLTNYTWILIEGIYLHMLLFIMNFSNHSSIKYFIMAGWGSAFVFLIPWIIVRSTIDNVGCWSHYKNRALMWILEAPITGTELVNFIFFIIILRLSFKKIKSSNKQDSVIYRKLAKSALVLIPLSGVHYMVFLFTEFIPRQSQNAVLEVVGFYFDSLFTSLQGFMVSCIFCFGNSEVRTELLKLGFNKFKESRQRHPRTRKSSTTTNLTTLNTSTVPRPSCDLTPRPSCDLSRRPSFDLEDLSTPDLCRVESSAEERVQFLFGEQETRFLTVPQNQPIFSN